MGALPLTFIPHSVHRADHNHVVRLVAVQSRNHVALGPLEMRRVDINAFFANLSGPKFPYLSLVHDGPLAKLPRRTH